jgi:hypothetical protein
MRYTYSQISKTDWALTVIQSEQETICFNMSTDPERGFPQHTQMILDFEDVAKLEYFVSLLLKNPSTAFSIYNNLA